jgi:hypothetical protein
LDILINNLGIIGIVSILSAHSLLVLDFFKDNMVKYVMLSFFASIILLYDSYLNNSPTYVYVNCSAILISILYFIKIPNIERVLNKKGLFVLLTIVSIVYAINIQGGLTESNIVNYIGLLGSSFVFLIYLFFINNIVSEIRSFILYTITAIAILLPIAIYDNYTTGLIMQLAFIALNVGGVLRIKFKRRRSAT